MLIQQTSKWNICLVEINLSIYINFCVYWISPKPAHFVNWQVYYYNKNVMYNRIFPKYVFLKYNVF